MLHLNKSIFSFHHQTSRGPHYVWLSHKLSNHPNIHAWIENEQLCLTDQQISNQTWTSRIDNDCCIFRIWETENAWPPSQNLICLNIHGFLGFSRYCFHPIGCRYLLLPVISLRICLGPEYFDKIPRQQQQRCTDGAASKAENLWAIFLQRIVIMMDICRVLWVVQSTNVKQ